MRLRELVIGLVLGSSVTLGAGQSIGAGAARGLQQALNPQPDPPVSFARLACGQGQIDGNFTGWDGRTTVALTDGSVYRQQDATYRYYAVFAPRVIVYQDGVRLRMHVVGMADDVAVERLR